MTSILFVGHSLVNTTMPTMVDQLLEDGVAPNSTVHHQVINGAPLWWNWEHSAEAQGVDGRALLASTPIDAVVLTEAVPLDNHLQWSNTVANAVNYAQLALSTNPNARVFIYETWHDIRSGTGVDVEYDNGDSVPWRQRLIQDAAKWQGIADGVNAALPDSAPEVRVIPVGQALGRLADAIAAGQIPGLTSITDLFADSIHLNATGNAFVAMIQYAAITGRSPEGLTDVMLNEWGGVAVDIPDALGDALQASAWASVQALAPWAVTDTPTPTNTAPVAVDDLAQATAGVPLVIDAKANDTDADNDALTIVGVGTPGHGTATLVGQTIVYTAQAGHAGADTFTYTLRDARGLESQGTVRLTVAPAPTDPVDPVDPGTPTDPSGTVEDPVLGLGLNGVTDWSTQLPFIDVFKSSRPWTGHLEGQWGGFQYDQLAEGGWLDANGWLRDMPPGVTGVTALMLTELPAEMTSAAGTYRMTYSGEGDFTIQGATNIVQVAPGVVTFTYTPNGSNTLGLTITDTNPANHLRDISIVHADHVAAFEAGAVFNPDWIARIEDVRSLRFMDWMRTNNSDLSAWADRAEVGDATWGTDAGVPLEVMIRLANETGTDPWFTIPHQADADFIARFATLVRDTLDPDLKAHVEYSNEVWNWQFDQAQWAHAEGQERWGTNVGDAWVQFYGMKAAQMAEIWRGVFGPDQQDRLEMVISVQTGWLGLEPSVLDAPEWVAEGNAAPHTLFDSYAITGYFDGGLGRDGKAQTVLGWIATSQQMAEAAANTQNLTGAAREAYIAAHRYDHATALAIQELRDGSVTGNREGSLEHLAELFAYHKAEADARGLALTMYEGGTHVVGVGAWVDNTTLTDFFLHLNYTDAMGALYVELFEAWKDAGGTLFNAFVDVASPSKWGSWGGLRHLDDQTARWDALMAYNADTEGAWWETRAPGTFAGTTGTPDPVRSLLGTAGNDTLAGDAGRDLIDGLAGNDSLSGLGGNDTLMGGAGNDTLRGGDGDDALMAGAGSDRAWGGLGNDSLTADGAAWLYGDEGNDVLTAGAGPGARLYGGTGNDTLGASTTAATLRGEDGDDRLVGGTGNDSLFGGNQDDVLEGGGGDDRLAGDNGHDTVWGGDGQDRATGGAGNDFLNGGEGHDTIDAGSGNDTVEGGNGHDSVLGGTGNDTASGLGGDDRLFGGRGHDLLNGGSGHDWLAGGGENDTLLGGTGNDTLVGDEGGDALSGGSGRDQLFGGTGRDVLSGGMDSDTLLGGEGMDILEGGSGADRFVWRTAAEVGLGSESDTIADFERGQDRIDTSAFLRAADMIWRGESSFTGRAGEVRFLADTGVVQMDINGDGRVDARFVVEEATALGVADFL